MNITMQISRERRTQIGNRLLYLIASVVHLLPLGVALAFGRFLGWLAPKLSPRHFHRVRDDMAAAFGDELTQAGATQLARQFYIRLGEGLVEFLRIPTMTADEIIRWTRIEGTEYIDAARAEGKGVVFLTAHLGNWELLALILSTEGWKLAGVGRELDNPLLEARLREFRMKHGNSVIAKDGAVRGTIKALKEGRFVGFLLDQDALAAGVFVKFMGRWASTFPTPGMLAARFDLPVLPVSSRVDRDGLLTVTIHPPFHAPKTGDPARDAWTATQRMTAWIEDRVRETPGQWFWMHRRFKTQPGPGEPDLPPDAWCAAADAREGW